MKQNPNKLEKRKRFPLLLPIILIFCVLGTVVFSVSQKIAKEMSESAVQNLSESLDLIQSTIEAILHSEAEFQTLITQEIARTEGPDFLAGKAPIVMAYWALPSAPRRSGLEARPLFLSVKTGLGLGAPMLNSVVCQAVIPRCPTFDRCIE